MGSDIDEPGLDLLIEFILITLVKELGPSRGASAKQATDRPRRAAIRPQRLAQQIK